MGPVRRKAEFFHVALPMHSRARNTQVFTRWPLVLRILGLQCRYLLIDAKDLLLHHGLHCALRFLRTFPAFCDVALAVIGRCRVLYLRACYFLLQRLLRRNELRLSRLEFGQPRGLSLGNQCLKLLNKFFPRGHGRQKGDARRDGVNRDCERSGR